MSKIKIKNFGPIKEGYQDNDGWIDIKKVTVFIGNQGSGKSTIAKLISTFTWIEKALVRGDYNKEWFAPKNILKDKYLNYYLLEDYFDTDVISSNDIDKTIIDYQGDAYLIKYHNGFLNIEEKSEFSYQLPQIMYIPAERNFISYVKTPKELKLASAPLKEFLTEFENAKETMKGMMELPINHTNIEYDKFNDTINLKGESKGMEYKVKLTDASSGFQSLVPLFLVSQYLSNSVKKQGKDSTETMSSNELRRFKKGVADVWGNKDLTDEQKRAALSVLSLKFNKTAFINIVEEPEQNLFPSSQWKMLKSLLEFNNSSSDNKLIMSTHSPFIINFLSIAIQGEYLKRKIDSSLKSERLLPQLNNIISEKSLVSSDNVVVYQLNEEDGTIKILPSPEGIPSDRNYLNDNLREGNDLFDALLEIEEEL